LANPAAGAVKHVVSTQLSICPMDVNAVVVSWLKPVLYTRRQATTVLMGRAVLYARMEPA